MGKRMHLYTDGQKVWDKRGRVYTSRTISKLRRKGIKVRVTYVQ